MGLDVYNIAKGRKESLVVSANVHIALDHTYIWHSTTKPKPSEVLYWPF